MKVVSFFSSKGGVGKTTLLCNLASYLAKFSKKKVLVIDGDPQSNASVYLLDERSINNFYYSESESLSWYLETLEGKGGRPRIFRSESFEIDVIPGHPRLEMIGNTISNKVKSSNDPIKESLSVSFFVKEMLAEVSGNYDFVFVDMSPSAGLLNKNLILASDFFLAPISVDYFGAVAIKNVLNLLSAWRDEFLGVERQIEFKLKFAGYVMPKHRVSYSKGGRNSTEYDEVLKQLYPHLKYLEEQFGFGDPESANLGFIPNLTSLISLSQMIHKPVFDLGAIDGVTGVQFAAVDDAKTMYATIAKNFLHRIAIASKEGF